MAGGGVKRRFTFRLLTHGTSSSPPQNVPASATYQPKQDCSDRRNDNIGSPVCVRDGERWIEEIGDPNDRSYHASPINEIRRSFPHLRTLA